MITITDIRYTLRCLFKYPYQRVRYGYDERIKWGFDYYFDNMLKPLKEFCKEELKDIEHVKFNRVRMNIYKKTLEKIKVIELAEDYICSNKKYDAKKYIKLEKNGYQARAYIAKNIGWYWN